MDQLSRLVEVLTLDLGTKVVVAYFCKQIFFIRYQTIQYSVFSLMCIAHYTVNCSFIELFFN